MKSRHPTSAWLVLALLTAPLASCTSKSKAELEPPRQLGESCVAGSTPAGNCSAYPRRLQCVGGSCIAEGSVGATCASHGECQYCGDGGELCVNSACVEGSCSQNGEVLVAFNRCAVSGALQSTIGTTTSAAPVIRGCMVRYRVSFKAPNAVYETAILLSTTASDDVDNPASGSIVIRTSAILGSGFIGVLNDELANPTSGIPLTKDNAEMVVVSATGAKDYAAGRLVLVNKKDPWDRDRSLMLLPDLAIDASFGLVLPDISHFGDVTVTSDGLTRTLAGEIKITSNDGAEPLPLSVGSCTDVASGVCTQLVKGDLEQFEQSCLKDGDNRTKYAAQPCPAGGDFVCKNGTGTDNVTGASITIEVHWPRGYCASNPSQNLAGTCSKSLGSTDWDNNGGCGGASSCTNAWTCKPDAQAGSLCQAACGYQGAQRTQTCAALEQTFPNALACCPVCK